MMTQKRTKVVRKKIRNKKTNDFILLIVNKIQYKPLININIIFYFRQ